ncbi:hypothetical protein MLD38_038403 [Melastoma candidum]|uniref:Uncharacterized protein n=1 Tax=Melastoma candidum TaxID=119954 RepID=A0ACB9L129_9MYRT|nr:hypothetical protein MLD38_038403 [Melastoma candidum]
MTLSLSRFIPDTSAASAASLSFNPFRHRDLPKPDALGILAYEAAKTMSRLLSLYRSLSNEELDDLRSQTLKSRGVRYLISSDESFLLNLAGLELLEELEYVVASVSRFSCKCSDVELSRFDLVYADLKKGYVGIERSEFSSRKIAKIVEKVERLTTMTGNLHASMLTLSEMEAYEEKVQRWRKNRGSAGNNNQMQGTDFSLFESKIAFQRKQAKRYMELSLWNVSFDKCTAMMTRIICNIYTRIQSFFTPFASQVSRRHDRLPKQLPLHYHLHPHKNIRVYPEISFVPVPHRNSGPIIPFSREMENPKLYCLISTHKKAASNVKRKAMPMVRSLASETTVGGAGLAVRYAYVVTLAGRVLEMMAVSSGRVDDEVRRELYDLLPKGLKDKVRTKLVRMKRASGGVFHGKEEEAEGWREGVEGIMVWLGDVSRDTLRWQEERSVEKRGFDDDGRGKRERRVVLAQTLHFADLEKTEAAIVEVLVGLSCMCRNSTG